MNMKKRLNTLDNKYKQEIQNLKSDLKDKAEVMKKIIELNKEKKRIYRRKKKNRTRIK